MAQLNYSINMNKGMNGQLADNGYNSIMSYTAQGDVPFGRVILASISGKVGYLPAANTGDLVFDAALVTGNEITVNFNGNTVVVDFDTDNNTTLDNIATAISGIDGFTATRDGTDTVAIVSELGALTGVSATVTGGATQAGATFTANAIPERVAGISLSSQREQNLQGNAEYIDGTTVNTLTRGRIYVTVETDVNVGDSVFYRVADGDLGAIRNDADGSDAVELTNARFVEAASAGNLAVLEINLP